MVSRLVGAMLGAIRPGFLRTAVDAGGLGGPSFRALPTAVDTCGLGLEIYGSGGWGFEVPPGVPSESAEVEQLQAS